MNNPPITIVDARLLNAEGVPGTEPVNLLVSNGRIDRIGTGIPEEQTAGSTRIEAAGRLLLPGFVDLCCNLREPGDGQKGNIESETLAAAHGGFTTVCASPETSPVNDSSAVTHLVRDVARDYAYARVLPLGAATRGLEGELLSNMVGLSRAGCIAMSNGPRPLASARVLRRCMAYAQTFGLTLMLQPVNRALAADGYAHEGQVAARLGLPGIPEVAETTAVMELLLLAEETGVRLHLGQLSCARSVDMVAGARARGVVVTADVAMHQLVYTDEALSGFNSRFHVRPPLRTGDDRKALLQGVEEGIIDAVVSQHLPCDSAGKQAPLGETEPGMSTIESVFPMGLMLVERGELSMAALVRSLTSGPASVIGRRAGLTAGADADFSLWALDEHWQAGAGTLRSRGVHAPVVDRKLPGVNHYTFCEGRLVWTQN